MQDTQIAGKVAVRTENLSLFLSTADIAASFGALTANGRTTTRTFVLQANGVDAVSITAHGIPHTSDADYEFNFTALGSNTLISPARFEQSSGLTYNDIGVFVQISHTNPIYATDARFEVLKEIVAASTDLPEDFRNRIANL